MGYTHYFQSHSHSDEHWAAIVADVNKVYGAAALAGITINEESNNMLPPVANDTLVRFNGANTSGHETMYYSKSDDWAFCKTACKRYDTVVVAVLAVAAYHTASNLWSSDGGPDDHVDGLALAASINPNIRISGCDYTDEELSEFGISDPNMVYPN